MKAIKRLRVFLGLVKDSIGLEKGIKNALGIDKGLLATIFGVNKAPKVNNETKEGGDATEKIDN